MKMHIKPAAVESGLSWFLGSLFNLAGALKVVDIPGFADEIANYRMVPENWQPFMAASLPFLEMLAGAALITKFFRLTGSIVTLLLISVFTSALGFALARGLDISCGCFGKGFEEYEGKGLGALFRDIILLGLVSGCFVWFCSEN